MRSIRFAYPNYIDDLQINNQLASLDSFANALSAKLDIFSESWFWLFSVIPPNSSLLLIILVILLCLFIIGFIIRISQLKPDAISIPFYIGAILVWPYDSVYFLSCFLFPLLPLLLFYMWVALQHEWIGQKKS